MRVADQRDALSCSREASRLLQREEGLSAPGTAADLDARQLVDGAQDDRLVCGECIGDVLVVDGACDDVALWKAPAAERHHELLDTGVVEER